MRSSSKQVLIAPCKEAIRQASSVKAQDSLAGNALRVLSFSNSELSKLLEIDFLMSSKLMTGLLELKLVTSITIRCSSEVCSL